MVMISPQPRRRIRLLKEFSICSGDWKSQLSGGKKESYISLEEVDYANGGEYLNGNNTPWNSASYSKH